MTKGRERSVNERRDRRVDEGGYIWGRKGRRMEREGEREELQLKAEDEGGGRKKGESG